jgi:hypothetical protein
MTRRVFEAPLGTKVSVWLNELPKAALVPPGANWDERTFPCGGRNGVRRAAAIEIFRPFGGSFHYGLLGGELENKSQNFLKVVAPCSSSSGSLPYTEALSASLDRVIVGGADEYTSAIYAGIEREGRDNLPGGGLHITCMTHGQVGSARIVYQDLAGALIRLFIEESEPTSLEDAMVLLGYRA